SRAIDGSRCDRTIVRRKKYGCAATAAIDRADAYASRNVAKENALPASCSRTGIQSSRVEIESVRCANADLRARLKRKICNNEISLLGSGTVEDRTAGAQR